MNLNLPPFQKIFVLISALFSFIFSEFVCAQAVHDPYFQNKQDTILSKNQMVVRNSKADTIEIASLKNGKKHGKQTLFSNNGKISKISNYRNGLLHGRTDYYEEGFSKIYRTEHYKSYPSANKSDLHGSYAVFSPAGKLVEKYIFQNGRKNGWYTLYHEDDKIREAGYYESDLITGNKKTWSKDGILREDENYIIIPNPLLNPTQKNQPGKKNTNLQKAILEKISVLHGNTKHFFSDGKLALDHNLKYGKKEGLNREYYENQKLKAQAIYKDDEIHGTYATYHQNGNIETRGIFYKELKIGEEVLQNVRDGTIERFDENGHKTQVENWKNYKRNGAMEFYAHGGGKISSRTYYKDGLVSGSEERFDKEGNKTSETHYEIVEKDGKKISQQTGIVRGWERGILRSEGMMKNGLQEGKYIQYYPDGKTEAIRYYTAGKLNGPQKTFHPNGQLKEDFIVKILPSGNLSGEMDWNTIYDEMGNIQRKHYGYYNRKAIEYVFENGVKKTLTTPLLSMEFSPGLASVIWNDGNNYPVFGYSVFTNNQLRRIRFQTQKYHGVVANVDEKGKIIQIRGNENINDQSIEETAVKIAKKFNKDWKNEKFVTDTFPEGKYQWKYADGQRFFEIEFKDRLPQGQWIQHHPLKKDTLVYAEFDRGQHVGKFIWKNIDGRTIIRKEFFPNHQVKTEYRYGEDGHITEKKVMNENGQTEITQEYYPGGKLKSRNNWLLGTSLSLNQKSDTISYSDVIKKGVDSIRIDKEYYASGKRKLLRMRDHKTGIGSGTSWFENGKIQIFQGMMGNTSHGDYRRYDEMGNLLAEGNFVDGKRDGKWTTRKENGQPEITYFKNGEIQISQTEAVRNDKKPCQCYDTSLPQGKIGFANQLKYLTDFNSIIPFIPPAIIPIDGWNYDKIFYVNFNSNNDRSSGSTQFKLLFLQNFSFVYPAENYLKFDLTPCKTEGYIDNFTATLNYSFEKTAISYSTFGTKRISVTLQKNPLTEADSGNPYTVFMDTDQISFSPSGIDRIYSKEEGNMCFPKGKIGRFLDIEIRKAILNIQPQNNDYAGVPLLENEIQRFYGFDISEATLHFSLENKKIEASSQRILSGANFTAGKIVIKGKKENAETFVSTKEGVVINMKTLKNIFEQKGFFRIKTETSESELIIDFYTEK